MSIVSIVHLPEGIVVAADSRLTETHTAIDNEKTTLERFTISDNGQKIVV